MKRVTFQLELVTPCFLGGADRHQPAEWRSGSVRGQLRWWFRAVAASCYREDLAAVRATEQALFGDTSRGSSLQVRTFGSFKASPANARCLWGRPLNEQDLANAWKDASETTQSRLTLKKGASNPIHYLAYGCVVRSVFEHGYIEAGQIVSLELQWRRDLQPEERDLLRKTIWCWLNLGGIGARSRRGFGSLRCTAMQGEDLGTLADFAPASRSAFRKQAQAVLPPQVAEAPLPGWSHLSSASRIYIGRQAPERWEEALMLAGAWLIAFRRRYGSKHHPHPVLEPGSARDYEWAARNGSLELKGKGIPDRAGFGLPLPFGEGGETVTWGDSERDGRRASPLLLHVARFGTDEYVPVFTYLPARLIPADEQLYLKHREDSNQVPAENPTAIIGCFLADLKTKELVSEIRP